MNQQLDRKDLKIRALLDKIGKMTAQHEDKVADFRVDYTVLESENQQLKEEVNNLSQELAAALDTVERLYQGKDVEIDTVMGETIEYVEEDSEEESA